jgi:hypothetical protein
MPPISYPDELTNQIAETHKLYAEIAQRFNQPTTNQITY